MTRLTSEGRAVGGGLGGGGAIPHHRLAVCDSYAEGKWKKNIIYNIIMCMHVPLYVGAHNVRGESQAFDKCNNRDSGNCSICISFSLVSSKTFPVKNKLFSCSSRVIILGRLFVANICLFGLFHWYIQF